MTDRPFPGEQLAARVAGTGDRDWFFESGQRSVRETAALLGVVGRGFADFERILDFGAGCGRMAAWLDDLPGEVHATDIDPEAVAWMDANLPHVQAVVNDAMPPLPYPDDYFGLVYNHSVLTHLDERMQDAWLAELRRVTRPGGLVVLTFHGEPAFAAAEPDAQARAIYDERGILFVSHPTPGLPDWYGVTYHAAWYVLAHWSNWLRVCAYVPRGALGLQDMVLLSPDTGANPYAPPAREAPQPSRLQRAVKRLR
jgi:SAM-dependent methyltransferase